MSRCLVLNVLASVTAATKIAQGAKLRDIVSGQNIDLVLLAPHMQVLSLSLCEYLNGRAIDILHSFFAEFERRTASLI